MLQKAAIHLAILALILGGIPVYLLQANIEEG
jgi:hypothetical protein